MRHCMACSLWRSTSVHLKDYWHSAHAFPVSGFPPGVLPFLVSFGLAACTKMFSTWDFRSAGAFPAFLLTEAASVPAWQFAAGYAPLHGFALPHGAETARRCVKHSLLERPGPKGLSSLQAQGLFGSRMGRFSTFCVSKVEKVSSSLGFK